MFVFLWGFWVTTFDHAALAVAFPGVLSIMDPRPGLGLPAQMESYLVSSLVLQVIFYGCCIVVVDCCVYFYFFFFFFFFLSIVWTWNERETLQSPRVGVWASLQVERLLFMGGQTRGFMRGSRSLRTWPPLDCMLCRNKVFLVCCY